MAQHLDSRYIFPPSTCRCWGSQPKHVSNPDSVNKQVFTPFDTLMGVSGAALDGTHGDVLSDLAVLMVVDDTPRGHAVDVASESQIMISLPPFVKTAQNLDLR